MFPLPFRFRFPGAQPVSFGGYHIDELKQENYFVSEKADGIRCLLFTRTLKDLTVESYLIDRKNNYYKHRFGLPMPKLKTSHRHTIVDGELVIEQKTGRDPELYFLLFDALVVDEKNLTRRPYTSRLGYLRQHVIQPYQESCAKNPKYRKLFPFTFRQKRLELSYQLPIVFRHMQSYQHETDGVIFTSAVAPYTFGTCDKMLKWKPAEENTVDFKILKVQVNGEFERHLGILIQNEEYEDFGKLTLDSATEEKWKNDNYYDRIIECRFDFNWPNHWKFSRFRDDKLTANHISVYKKIKESINDNVTKEMLIEAAPSIYENWRLREPNTPAPRT
ncbi:mRNA capping enzyme, catalytic domain-containing protein [Globomyces pollinis-pini]|nr:mRNA capping enzyme, catalytic domain-containing protein [Globomyces pollinis-pini]